MKTTRSLSFKYKLIFAFLFTALFPLIICSVLMVEILKTSLNTSSKESAISELNEVHRKLDELFSTFETISTKISENNFLKKSMIDNSVYETDVYLSLYKISAGLPAGSVLSLYDCGGKIKYTTNNLTAYGKLKSNWGVLKKAALSDKTVYYNVESFNQTPTAYSLYTGKTLLNSEGALLGYVVISIPKETLVSSFISIPDNQRSIFILDSTGALLFSSHSSDITSNEIKALRENIIYQDSNFYEEQNNQFFIKKHENSGFHIILEKPKIINTSTTQIMSRIGFYTGLLSFVLCFICSVLLSRNLSKPISKLSEAMTKVKNGNLDTRIETKKTDELGQLTKDFNRMTTELEEYVKKAIEHQKEKNQTELRLLQAQLNPHFLYNTLDTVKWLGRIYKVPDVSDICSSLAIILRECVSKEQTVTLKKEFTTLKNYVKIQKIRFSDKFIYREDLPKEFEECIIPKLVLQPIVENSIVHGLSYEDSGYISVEVEKIDNDLIIKVTDNGQGMPPEMMEILNNAESKMVDGHLGLYNVNYIIKINYGMEYGLKTESLPSGGTIVKLRIPIMRRDDYV